MILAYFKINIYNIIEIFFNFLFFIIYSYHIIKLLKKFINYNTSFKKRIN